MEECKEKIIVSTESKKRGKGRPKRSDPITAKERQREYMKNPEFREAHRLKCQAYNNKMKLMREYCKNNKIEC
jgi:hypothetical protein